MPKFKTVSVLAGGVLFAFIAAVTAFNVINLNEAYGSGEPYYSRTTNMDKWSDPLPVLAAVDGGVVLLVAGGFFLWRQKHKQKAPPRRGSAYRPELGAGAPPKGPITP